MFDNFETPVSASLKSSISGQCTHKRHKHKIESVYEKACKDYEYWNFPAENPTDEDFTFGRKCKSCKWCERA